MKRVVTPELLDRDSGTPSQIALALSDLRRINRWFGGVRTTQSLVEYVCHKRRLISPSLLEVAAGAGDVPELVGERVKMRGIHLECTLLDRRGSHLKCRSNPRRVVGDALSLPVADSSFDLVSCCLFLHHLEPDALVRFVNESLGVCRVALLINDLIRDPLHLTLVYAGWPLYRSPMTRHDGPASVRAAYTIQEVLELLRSTAAGKVEISRHYLFRMGVVVWK